jgi:hypothetical protein
MPPTKSFNDLVQNRVTNDPDFTAALVREAADAPLTIHGALRPSSSLSDLTRRGSRR